MGCTACVYKYKMKHVSACDRIGSAGHHWFSHLPLAASHSASLLFSNSTNEAPYCKHPTVWECWKDFNLTLIGSSFFSHLVETSEYKGNKIVFERWGLAVSRRKLSSVTASLSAGSAEECIVFNGWCDELQQHLDDLQLCGVYQAASTRWS